MSAPAFTPYPWEPRSRLAFGDGEFAVETTHVQANEGRVVALTCGPDAEANARLIASAPRMYGALEEAETTLRILVEIAEDIKLEGAPMIAERLSNVSAALREARGEQ